MNKVFNVNLGGYPFTIDENAFQHLKQYLDALRDHFKTSEGADEIVMDIEMRTAEILQERLENRKIVSLEDVKTAIAMMGTPEDFGAEATFGEAETQTQTEEKTRDYGIKTGKRFFRNPDDSVIGGVCSGLAAYLGIQDPVWIRIIIAILAFGSFGFLIPLYILLMVIVPEAKTSADKLAMRGEPINVDNIAKVIEKEVNNIAEKVNKFGSDMNKKKATVAGVSHTNETADATEKSNEIKFVVLDFFKWLKRPVLITIGTLIIIILAVFWIAAILGFGFSYPYAGMLFEQPTWQAPLFTAAGLLLVGIPLLKMVLWCARVLFGSPVHRRWRIGSAILWGLSLSALFLLLSTVGRDFNVRSHVTKDIPLENANAETLSIVLDVQDHRHNIFQLGNATVVDNKTLAIPNVYLHIMPSKDNQFHLEQVNTARGGNARAAKKYANDLQYTISEKTGQLILSNVFTLNTSNKWRIHGIDLNLYVPEGKSIELGGGYPMHQILYYEPQTHQYWDTKATWTMTDGILTCATCEPTSTELPPHEANPYFQTSFNQLEVEGNVKVIINKNDHPHVRLAGKHQDKVTFEQDDELLSVLGPDYELDAPIRVYIDMPTLETLIVNNTDDVRVNGFQEEKIVMKVESDNELHANLNVAFLDLTIGNYAKVNLKGAGEFLKANLYDAASLDADRYEVEVANVEGTTQNHAKVNVKDTLFKKIDKIKFEGEPVVLE